MKTTTAILFFFLCSATVYSFPIIASASNSTGQTATNQEIRLHATSIGNKGTKSAPICPLKVWLYGDYIELSFLMNMGSVTVTITGVNGVVYNAVHVATAMTSYGIVTGQLPTGDYTITIKQENNGRSYSGQFEL